MTKQEVIEKLNSLGWHTYLNDATHFKWNDTNRYVDIDLPYIDVYTYADEEKYKGYLDADEFILFSELITIMTEEGK